MERYNMFDYEGIVTLAVMSTPETDKALLEALSDGTFTEVHEAIKSFVRKQKALEKEIERERVLLGILAVICFEWPRTLRPDGIRLCDRCYEPLPEFGPPGAIGVIPSWA
jgi:hypothetical protein